MAKAPIDLRSLARSHTETAVRTLASIMNDKEAPHPARVSAAVSLLDRGWGKPKETVDHNIVRRLADLSDHELTDIAAGSSEGVADAPSNPSQLN